MKKCLGVDVGSGIVKVVELAADKSGVRVLNAASMETGLDPSASAEQRRAAILAALKAVLKKGRFSTKSAVFGLSGTKVFIRRFRLPQTTPERLQRIVRYEARNQIPFPLDQTDWQYQAFPVAEEKEVDILLAAVRQDEVAEFMTIVDKSGLKPVAIGVTSLALYNAARLLDMDSAALRREVSGPDKPAKVVRKKAGKADEPEEEEAPPEAQAGEGEDFSASYEDVSAIACIGATSFDLVITARSGEALQFKFARSVNRGGNNITQAIQRKCAVEAFEDAERIKQHQARLLLSASDADGDEAINLEASQVAGQATDLLLTEIRKSLDYFISQPDGMAVDRLQLAGGGAALGGCEDYMAAKLSLPAEIYRQPPGHSAFNWGSEAEPLALHLEAVGYALQGLGLGGLEVDFLPQQRKVARDFPYVPAGIMAALLAVLVAVTSQAGQGYINAYRGEAGRARGQIESLRPRADRQAEVRSQHDELRGILEQLEKVAPQRDYTLALYSDILAVTPPGVAIEQLQIEPDGYVLIRGTADRQTSATSFNQSLRDMVFKPVYPPTLTALPSQSGARFEIRFQVSEKQNWTRMTSDEALSAAQGAAGGGGGGRPGGGRGGRGSRGGL